MVEEDPSSRSKRAQKVDGALSALYPKPSTELDHCNPFELLVATVLSAQCTDVRVNMVTPALFARYPDAKTLSQATPANVEPFINSLGLFRNKAKNLVALALALVERHGGEVPPRREALEALAGVGRKTASVVLASGFGIPALAVDTHVLRLSKRLGFSQATTPLGVEKALVALFPEERWHDLHHSLILHGRRVCLARKPKCGGCVVATLCPSVGEG